MDCCAYSQRARESPSKTKKGAISIRQASCALCYGEPGVPWTLSLPGYPFLGTFQHRGETLLLPDNKTHILTVGLETESPQQRQSPPFQFSLLTPVLGGKCGSLACRMSRAKAHSSRAPVSQYCSHFPATGLVATLRKTFQGHGLSSAI